MHRPGSSFSNKRVAVFGASGFLGGATVARLIQGGASVVALSRGLATSAIIPPEVDLVLGDMRRKADVERALQDVSAVFFLAGRSGAAESFRDPQEDLAVNANGLLNVLQCLVTAAHQAKIVFPGSRLQYGVPGSLPVDEEAPLRPNSPYALHKVVCEEYLRLYRERYGVNFAIARLTNPYGPATASGWNGYNAINGLILRALGGKPLEIYGDGAQLRDYIYIDDAVDALLTLASGEDCLTVNVGSGLGISVADAAEEIVRITGSGSVCHVPWPADAKSVETGDFVADISRLRALGWSAKTTFRKGLSRTVSALRRSTVA